MFTAVGPIRLLGRFHVLGLFMFITQGQYNTVFTIGVKVETEQFIKHIQCLLTGSSIGDLKR